MAESVKIINAALDEDGKEIILRGVVDPSSLQHLKVDDYQREILPAQRINALVSALREGGVPDVELGMRGGSFLEREGAFYLQDPVYIIDGLQRRTAALKLMESGVLPRLGATIRFNTSREDERVLFRHLNMSRIRLSPNVLLRNERETHPAVEMLYMLSKDSSFVLHNRICWEQRMKRGHLLTSVGLLRASVKLHRHFGVTSGRVGGNSHAGRGEALEAIMNRIGRNVVRDNIKRFWTLLDECFGVRSVTYVTAAPFLRGGFLETLSITLGTYSNFWTDANLDVPQDLAKKLASFPIHDPHISSMCGTHGAANRILQEMIVAHLNSGKRTRRLRTFDEERYENGE